MFFMMQRKPVLATSPVRRPRPRRLTHSRHTDRASPWKSFYGAQPSAAAPAPSAVLASTPATVQQNGYTASPIRGASYEPPAASHRVVQEKQYDSLPRPQAATMRKLRHASCSIEDVESIPEPPSYNLAMQRLRSLQQWPRVSPSSSGARPSLAQSTSVGPSPNAVPTSSAAYNSSPRMNSAIAAAANMGPARESIRDTVIRHSVENTLNRHYRNRSSSLPRGARSDYEGYGDIYPAARQLYDFQMNRLPPSEQMAGSVDNLHVNTDFEYETELAGRRRLPATPLPLSALPASDVVDSIGRQPAYSRQRRCRRAMGGMLGRRSASVGRYDESPTLPFTDYDFMGGVEQAVRAQLIALDHRGFRTVLVEKIQPGPFGFYIATGVMNGQRGIFISRVSMRSLSPVLSVGDEILYVDDELVKGQTLEYVQSLIAGKTSVVIVLLPSAGPALC